MSTPAASALLTLGRLAEERGIDSAGLAMVHRRPVVGALSTAAVRDRVVNSTRIVTTLGAFSDRLPRWPRVRRHLGSARTVLGHTRWATQGRINLANASPLLVNDVVGTHNGDVRVPWGVTGTDTAWVLGMLDRTRSARSTAAVLAGLRGRAALAWTRLDRPDSLYLARAALSPLYTAYDTAGALWWASNPDWLRQIALRIGGLTEPIALPEGCVLVAAREPERIHIATMAKFTATCRPRDVQLANLAAWRGFSDSDREQAANHYRHRIAHGF